MKKVIVVPDSFKGTLTSQEVCCIMAQELRAVWPAAEIHALPVADGGEGSVDTFLAALGGEKRFLSCQGPFGEAVTGFFGLLPGGETAVVEMAAAAGLPQVGEEKNPERTSTYGVGQLIAAALETGARKVILGLGGSATNDGGCGAAVALGVRFFRADGAAFVPTGGTLGEIARIDCAAVDLSGAELVVMCDIDNPLCGPSGAAAVFGPQKGADAAMVERLDRGLAHFAAVVERELGRDIRTLPGAGAAGGMGGGFAALFECRLQMGIETVLDTVGFDELLQGADLVFTGEGKIDSQSLRGKVVIGVARRAKAQGVPVVAVVGAIDEGAEAAVDLGVSAMFSINRQPLPFELARGHSRENLRLTMANLLRYAAALETKHDKI